jgi:hypothetical protein
MGPDGLLDHRATLFINPEGNLSLTFYITQEKARELQELQGTIMLNPVERPPQLI